MIISEGWNIMKVVGLITEYNPFHNGHKYHIEEARKLTGADYVIAVMSGNFVQRGAPAITNKYARSIMALENGVDLVLELPVCFSTASAQYFALGAVTLLDRLGVVDYLCFGSECGDITLLEEAAKIFNNPTDSFNELINSYVREGLSFPAARAKAAQQSSISQNKDLLDIIAEPNNILGIEYIRALQQIKSAIKPVTIKRIKAHYHDQELHDNISSATAIRGILQNDKSKADFSEISSSVPESVYKYFADNYYSTFPISIDDFSNIIKYKLISENSNKLTKYLDLSSDLVERIKNIDIQNYGINELIQMIKSKNITHTRINRAMIHIMLNILTVDFLEYINDEIIYYARVLGFKKESSGLIRQIKDAEKIPVITKVSKAKDQLNSLGMRMFDLDIFASHLYNQVVYEKFKTSNPNEYKHGVCII